MVDISQQQMGTKQDSEPSNPKMPAVVTIHVI
jgi:hypothetical protein